MSNLDKIQKGMRVLQILSKIIFILAIVGLVLTSVGAILVALSLYGTSGSSYTLETREVLRLLHREFVYVGDPVPELNEQEHAAFLMNIQKSILLSLEKRKLLTHSQRERCLVELEKQYSREQKSRRRA